MGSIRDIRNVWRDNLVPASFRGAVFHVETSGRRSGRRTVVHEYPKRNIPYSEDMGRSAVKWSFTAYLILGDKGIGGNLLTQIDGAMKAFYDATVALGVASQVVTFTLSDFSRTFVPNGNLGTDHAWGSHHFVMGGSVIGGDFYGVAGSNGTVFPTLAPNGPDDTDQGSSARGRWIPTTSVDQYGATLASWFGVSSSDLPAVFPNIGRFNQSTLSFL